jgi:hypothetical protein
MMKKLILKAEVVKAKFARIAKKQSGIKKHLGKI